MPPCRWFLVYIWVRWLPLMLAAAQEQRAGEGCSGSDNRCGNLTILDPFWLVDIDKGRSCGSGSPDFEVSCYSNTPFIRSSTLYGFAVININYEEHSLRAVDWGKMALLCEPNSCDVLPTWNTSAKLVSPFRISDINLNLILYNCTEEAEAAREEAGGLVETKMGCGDEHKVFVSMGGRYDEASDDAAYAPDGCHACVVPVLNSSGEANASEYKQLISDGFLLTWGSPPHAPLAPLS